MIHLGTLPSMMVHENFTFAFRFEKFLEFRAFYHDQTKPTQPMTERMTCFIFSVLIGSGIFGGLFGESMYRYSYDLQTGTSHYRRHDGTVDSWQSPQRRGKWNSWKIQFAQNCIIDRIRNTTGNCIFTILISVLSSKEKINRFKLTIEAFSSDAASCFIAFFCLRLHCILKSNFRRIDICYLEINQKRKLFVSTV